MTLWIIYLTSTQPKLSKNVYVYCIIPSTLFTTISFKRVKNSASTGVESIILWCFDLVNLCTLFVCLCLL